MTQNAPAVADVATEQRSATDDGAIDTRFGSFAVDSEKIVTLPEGLYGLEEHHRFLLIGVPGWPESFKLLQSIDDAGLSLIVLPLEGEDGPIDRADFTDACRMLDLDPAATAVIGIVTMRADGAATVNLKAPLLIDSQRRIGRQHVFSSEKYHLRHPLPAGDPAAGEQAADRQAGG